MPGRVVLVGAGPGDPDLLTVRAVRELSRAEVLLYDALVPPALLSLVPEACECIDVGKRGDGTRGVAQEQIGALLVQKAEEGRFVVRLKGGDPFVFGRGGEEASALAAAGIAFEVVPGIASPLAVPAYAGIPVTDRRAASSVAVVTGHRAGVDPGGSIDWEGLARSASTLVVIMATAWVEDITRRIVEGGRDPRTPAAAIENGTTPRQRVVVAPLEELPARVREAGLRAPTVIVVGDVVRFREELQWFEHRPLFGRRVLTLRAEGRAGALALELLRRGASPVSVPLIAHEPASDPEPLRRALRAGNYDWWAFTSATAVRFVRDALESSAPARVGCIGRATAEAARAAGFPVAAVPSGAALPGELVRAMAELGPLTGARVLFPAAERARDALPRALEDAGARVDRVVAYGTVLPAGAPQALRKALSLRVDAVVFTSSSTVEHFVAVVGEAALAELANRVALAAIGPTTAASLRSLGLEPAVVSDRQTGEDLAQALERHFSEVGHGVS